MCDPRLGKRVRPILVRVAEVDVGLSVLLVAVVLHGVVAIQRKRPREKKKGDTGARTLEISAQQGGEVDDLWDQGEALRAPRKGPKKPKEAEG